MTSLRRQSLRCRLLEHPFQHIKAPFKRNKIFPCGIEKAVHSFFPAESIALAGEDGVGLIEAAAGVCAATVRRGAGAATKILGAERGGEEDVWGVEAC
jgi:hypothetical protein